MSSDEIVRYDHVSDDPHNFRSVFERQLSLADDIRGGGVDVDQGAAEAKALYGATKTLEVDLHARLFAHRLRRTAPPAIERPGGGAEADTADQ